MRTTCRASVTNGSAGRYTQPAGAVSHVAVANVRLAAVQKGFADNGARTVYLVDQKGAVFAHPDEKLAVSVASLKKLEIVDDAVRELVARLHAARQQPNASAA